MDSTTAGTREGKSVKKRRIWIGMIVTLAGLLLMGCKSTSEDYKEDLEALLSMGEDLEDAMDKNDMDDLLEAYQDAVDDTDVSTWEGKKIKEDFKELGDLIEQTFELIADKDSDEDDRKELEEDLEELEDDMKKHVKAFEKAAKNTGLSEEEVEKIEKLDIEF